MKFWLHVPARSAVAMADPPVDMWRHRAFCMALLLAGQVPISNTSAATCPALADIMGKPGLKFLDGSVAALTPLNVNPDGARASYTPGNHGFTYVANGLDLWENGSRRSCSKKSNTAECNARFREAESKGFAVGTAEFCVFAMEVEPLPLGAQRTACPDGAVAGNGKGRLHIGGEIPAAQGGMTRFYASTTALTQRVDGKTLAIDSGIVPAIVVPKVDKDLVGRVVWASYLGRSTFAVVGDTGPAFGEASIALHQLLRYGELIPQFPGPLPKDRRCAEAETSLKAPFDSYPDVKGDFCSKGTKPVGATDIRAYKGIEGRVNVVILGKASLPMKGGTSQVPVTVEALLAAAQAAGYEAKDLAEMAGCLN